MVTTAAERPLLADDVKALRGLLLGEVLSPGDRGYEPARLLWNGAIDRRPGAIARCRGSGDVLAAVRYARDAGLLVAGTASCDGGLVLDLSPMKGLQIDPAERTAWAQPGLLWGELDHQTQAFGLATTGGIVTHTGIAGLTLGGGIGWLMRKHGLTCDNLLAVDLVTADGQLVRASEREHPELFWGVRGGGGNFGVVTAFRYRLHEVGPTVLAGPILFPAADAGELLRFYRDFVRRAPDETTAFSGRAAGFAVNVNAVALPDDDAEQAAWARGFGEALRPLSAGVYMNFLDDEGQDRVRAAYGPARYRRLADLKKVWDPDNFFRRNQNIRPSA